MRKSSPRKAVAWIVILLFVGAGATALHFGAAGEPAKRAGGTRKAASDAAAASIAALAGRGSQAASTALRKYAMAAEHGPDLTVAQVDASGVTGDWQTLQIGGSAVARIVNRGDATASGPFKVTFFEDANADGHLRGRPGPRPRRHHRRRPRRRRLGERPAAVSGAVLFRDNLVHAFADSENAVAESSETNNVGASGSDCEFMPQPGAFHPIVEWAWTGSPTAPDSRNVLMTPAVIDLDRDGRPEIVFASTASRTGNSVEVGVLRAVRGDSGAELFTVTDPALRVNAASSVAAGDIDLDGYPEIVACDESGARVIVFEHDGTFKWRSQPLEAIHWGAPSIADLNADGRPEIVVGRQVLSAAGALLWTGTGGRAAQAAFTGPLSIVADINLDGIPEVIAGNTAYRADGSTLWMAPLGDGYNAVANFDADPEPEIVLVSYGEVFLLEPDGSIAWGPRAIPGGGDGGPPTVADFDGDGSPEIGVAGAQRYVVLETNGALKWESPTQDLSSNVTGSSVFDFDGDLSAEVVYRDELNLRVYRGSDGAVLFQVPMSSCTWFEYVLVADVDADGNAEMVAVANDSCWYGQQQGVFVLGDANDLWVATRRIWNQHAYHITNVNDDGTIPAIEADNWLTPGEAVQQLQAERPERALPARGARPDRFPHHVRLRSGHVLRDRPDRQRRGHPRGGRPSRFVLPR